MPITVICKSCGFVLYSGNPIDKGFLSIYDVLKKWGFKCPCCLSELKPIIQDYRIEILTEKVPVTEPSEEEKLEKEES